MLKAEYSHVDSQHMMYIVYHAMVPEVCNHASFGQQQLSHAMMALSKQSIQ